MRRVGLILCAVLICGTAIWAQGPITPAASVTSTVYDGTTPVLPRYVPVDAAISGDNIILPATAAKKIRVLAATLTMTGTAVTIQFQSGAGSAAQPLTGAMGPTAGLTLTLPFNPVGWFEASTNTLLNMSLSGAQSVDGGLVYVLVD